MKAIGAQAGLNLRVATYPGVISTHERDKIVTNIESVLVDQIVRHLTAHEETSQAVTRSALPAERDIVFKGTFEEVNAHFYEQGWSDGLPVVPPSLEKVEAFLREMAETAVR